MTRVEIKWEGEPARLCGVPTNIDLTNHNGSVIAEYTRTSQFPIAKRSESPFTEPMLEEVGKMSTLMPRIVYSGGFGNDLGDAMLAMAIGVLLFLVLSGVALVIWASA